MRPGQQLKSFLRERRARVAPEALGLPSSPTARTRGLRREDVAELLDVTPLWYALFESGSSGRRFSATFIDRLADVLALGADDREMLNRLVVESGHAARDLESRWREQRLRALAAAVADVAVQLADGTSQERTIAACVTTLHRIAASATEPYAGCASEGAGSNAHSIA